MLQGKIVPLSSTDPQVLQVRRQTTQAQLSSYREQSVGGSASGGEGRRPQPKSFRAASHRAHPLREGNTPCSTKDEIMECFRLAKNSKIKPSCSPSGISGQTLAEDREGFDRQQTQSRADPSGGTKSLWCPAPGTQSLDPVCLRSSCSPPSQVFSPLIHC